MKYVTARPFGVWSALLLSSALIYLTSCKKDPPSTSNENAKGYITSIDSGCSPNNVHGIWYNGIEGADSNYLEVTLNVTSPGKYNISTGAQNGVTFASSGTFSEIGIYTVKLNSTGAFTHFGGTTFSIKFDSSNCSSIVYALDSASRNYPDNTWECTANGRYYKGELTTFQTGLNLPPGQATALSISGSAHPVPTENAGFGIGINNGTIIDTLTYKSTDNLYTGFSISAFDDSKPDPEKYILNGHASYGDKNDEMTFKIKSIVPFVNDGVYKVAIYGTFSGTIIDAWHQNHIEPVTGGIFKLVK